MKSLKLHTLETVYNSHLKNYAINLNRKTTIMGFNICNHGF